MVPIDLSRFPRRRYLQGVTPIDHLARLSEALGGPEIYMKRDDLIALTLGGNKARKLEFLMADALEQGADTIITCGAVQSNHCRLTLAAAVREGLKCQLVLEERVPHSYDPAASGNNFLFRLLGPERVRVVPAGPAVEQAMEELAQEARAAGRRPYIIPVGGSSPIGDLGYVACTREILSQCFELGLSLDHIVVTSGSGGTHAGLLAGLTAENADIPVTGIGINRPYGPQREAVHRLANHTLALLGLDRRVAQERVRVFCDYIGGGYSVPTPEMVEAVRLTARTEGILLDPTYTGKAMAGLMDLISKGVFRRGERVLFLHTGGVPGLFAHTEVFQ